MYPICGLRRQHIITQTDDELVKLMMRRTLHSRSLMVVLMVPCFLRNHRRTKRTQSVQKLFRAQRDRHFRSTPQRTQERKMERLHLSTVQINGHFLYHSSICQASTADFDGKKRTNSVRRTRVKIMT